MHDAFTLTTTKGGIDITAADSSAGQDIDVLNTGGSINLTATESVNDAITMTATTGGIDIFSYLDIDDSIVINAKHGGIDITASDSTAGQDIDIKKLMSQIIGES